MIAFSFPFPDAKVRLEKLREDAGLRQKRQHMKYIETLVDDSNTDEAPLLKITQQQTERALQGSRNFTTQSIAETGRKPNNLPFFQSRKPINFDPSETKTGDAKIVGSSESSCLNPMERRPKQSFFQAKRSFSSQAKDTESNKTSSKSDDSTKAASESNQSNASGFDQLAPLSDRLSSDSSNQKKELSPGEKARREHFSRLRQAGWIMGLDGKWYKDENAEFDSDEDEPPMPP